MDLLKSLSLKNKIVVQALAYTGGRITKLKVKLFLIIPATGEAIGCCLSRV